MAIYVHAPLPGPFTVSKRIGGRRRPKTNPLLAVAGVFLLGPLFVAFMALWVVAALALVLTSIAFGVALLTAPFSGRVRRFELARKPLRAPVLMFKGLVQACRKVGLA